MTKVLVCAQDYPNNEGSVRLMYIHTRNLYYKAHDIDVTVLNFNAAQDYVIDGIPVITAASFAKSSGRYDILVLHAANLRSHFPFLLRHGKKFPKFLFFYHGHEVLKVNHVYSKPYPYVQQNPVTFFLQDCYDAVKLFVWRHYLPSVAHKSHFVFVSSWMYEEFLKNTGVDPKILEGRYSITYNSIGQAFETLAYDDRREKDYDFITIRSFLDGSKYGIDIVNRLAKNSPDCKFLLVGKGSFFDHYPKADNIEWRNQTMSHEEIVAALQSARFALMPTRTDAQGLMMCEMAAFGIPLITSDIPVCHEVFGGFENVSFIDNDDEALSLSDFREKPSLCVKDDRYTIKNTVSKEVELLNRMKG